MKFIFISREGKENAGARLRAYGWAKVLRDRYNLDTEVFSFADNLGGAAGVNEGNFGAYDKLIIAARSITTLIKYKNPCCFIINRINYHSFPVSMICKLKRINLILDVDDWEAKDLSRNRSFSFSEYFMKWLAKKSIFCIGASKFMVDYLKKYNNKTYYLPTGADLTCFRDFPYSDNENNKIVLSWHGTINREENIAEIKLLADVFSLLMKRGLGSLVELRIKGGGFFYKDVVSILKNMKVEYITIFPWSKWQDIPLYIKNIDIGVVPLKDSIYNMAKSPTKIFEYMAMGKPVVSSCVGEAENIIKDGVNGMLCRNKEEFVDKLEELIENKQKREKIGENAYLSIERNYSIEVVVDKLYSILRGNGLV